jgi:hypothetical protein
VGDQAVGAHGLFGEPAEELGRIGRLAHRVGAGLAVFQRDQMGEILEPRGHQLPCLAQDLGAFARRARAQSAIARSAASSAASASAISAEATEASTSSVAGLMTSKRQSAPCAIRRRYRDRCSPWVALRMSEQVAERLLHPSREFGEKPDRRRGVERARGAFQRDRRPSVASVTIVSTGVSSDPNATVEGSAQVADDERGGSSVSATAERLRPGGTAKQRVVPRRSTATVAGPSAPRLAPRGPRGSRRG